MLCQSQLTDYRCDGHITPSARLDASTVARIRAKMERLFAERPELDTDFLPNLIEIDRSWLAFARLPAILDVVEQLIGPDIIVWGSALFCKNATVGKATPWHQDGHYWPIKPLETVTVWIAIDPATAENGCLRVIPGSHAARELYAHAANGGEAVVLNQELDLSRFGDPAPRDVVLDAGGFSVHDVYLIHGAEPNRSVKRRAGMTFRYMPAGCHFDRQLAARQARELGVLDLSKRELHLVRGNDVNPINDGVFYPTPERRPV